MIGEIGCIFKIFSRCDIVRKSAILCGLFGVSFAKIDKPAQKSLKKVLTPDNKSVKCASVVRHNNANK